MATTGGAKIEINAVGDVTGRRFVDVCVKRDTIFTLLLTPDMGAPISKSLTIEVSKRPPTIHSLMANPSRRVNAKPVMLTWRVTGAERGS